MNLVIPAEFKSQINSLSGYISHNSPFSKKTSKGLFLSAENESFLSDELYKLLNNDNFVNSVYDNLDASTVMTNPVGMFADKRKELKTAISDYIWNYKLPYREEVAVKNPVIELHLINKKFLINTSETFIKSPQMLIHDIYDYDPETKTKMVGNYSYGSASYADGTWHPEHLFTENGSNRNTPYWTPRSVTFDSNPPGGPFSRKTTLRNRNNEHLTDYEPDPDYPFLERGQKYAAGSGPGNQYMYDSYGDNGFSGGGLFPRWQYSMNDRPYDRSSEGLREGGAGDRRTQSTRGYDMSALLSKSTY